MLKPDQIPDEAVEAAARALYDILRSDIDPLEWTEIGDWRQNYFRKEARAAIAAALGAWPEAKRVKGYFTHDTDYYEPAFILPLPTENSDAELPKE